MSIKLSILGFSLQLPLTTNCGHSVLKTEIIIFTIVVSYICMVAFLNLGGEHCHIEITTSDTQCAGMSPFATKKKFKRLWFVKLATSRIFPNPVSVP